MRERLAGAVRQRDGAAHVLVGVARIDAEVERDLAVSSNFARLLADQELHPVRERVGVLAVDALRDRLRYVLASRHV